MFHFEWKKRTFKLPQSNSHFIQWLLFKNIFDLSFLVSALQNADGEFVFSLKIPIKFVSQ